eukprot:TRINITY_DN1354_c0_g1_i1.p4 TRINITY_DN1354_c0_g1~~TRINITY_DN1354_c0_g1_i1.p4  ORF type:complete len:150 (-),score=35.55 TRINITY_DN1354_c0_g1_i1:39-488(-)
MSHYSVLGLDASCDFDDVKRSYRHLAKRLHPDKNTNTNISADDHNNTNNDAELFQRVLQAYQVLSNPISRAAYDKQLAENALRKTVAIAEEVDLEDMQLHETSEEAVSYSWACRCGCSYVVTEDQLAAGQDVVSCSGCSLHIRVLYEAT